MWLLMYLVWNFCKEWDVFQSPNIYSKEKFPKFQKEKETCKVYLRCKQYITETNGAMDAIFLKQRNNTIYMKQAILNVYYLALSWTTLELEDIRNVCRKNQTGESPCNATETHSGLSSQCQYQKN